MLLGSNLPGSPQNTDRQWREEQRECRAAHCSVMSRKPQQSTC